MILLFEISQIQCNTRGEVILMYKVQDTKRYKLHEVIGLLPDK